MKDLEYLCESFSFDLLKFPQLIEQKKLNSIEFFLMPYRSNDSNFRGFSYVADLLTGEKEMLCYLIEIMANQFGEKYQAKQIMTEHQITEADF